MKKSKSSKTLPVAVVQMAGRLKDSKGNMDKACLFSKEAARKGAKLVLFPEGCLNGNAFIRRMQDFTPADPSGFTALQKIADRRGITICIGFIAPLDDKLNNAFAIIRPKDEILFQYKCARSSLEPEFLAAFKDEKRTVFEVDGIRTVISICCEYGLDRIEKAVKEAAPSLILHPSAGCLREDQVASVNTDEKEISSFKRKCLSGVESAASEVKRRGIPKICANPIGFDGETFWPGNSYAIDGNGEIVLMMPAENRPDHMVPMVEHKSMRI